MSETTRIHDRGYRRYDGPRTGPRGAIRTTAKYTFARILGLKRNGKAKVLPFIVAGIAYLPAIVFVGIGILVPKSTAKFLKIEYWEYYGFIILAIVLFIAFAAPEALCPDRRHRVMGVYLSSPLTRNTYLVAKFIAVVSALCFVTLFPPLLMALGKSIQGTGPSPKDFLVLVLRIIVSGLLLSVFFALLAMAASSLTDRKGFASAGIVLTFVITGATSSAIRTATNSDSAILLNLFTVPFELVRRVYNNNGDNLTFSNAALIAAFVLWAAAFAAIVAWRYRRLEVTR
jgi:ABC-2 type transport system permease protein